ncbi:hypothetical protein BGW37DRAFT_555239 [Umbelopsis sp. PMI_123]|nr:hypothetical protein BGW37DRAFT_555239 [Umbelopsis sp. PMI_123]
MCSLENKWWPALAKIGVDILSNAILSLAFLRVVYRQYKVFGNSLYKSLLYNGIIFAIGVILSNLIVGVLIASRVTGGLSADLYAFDWIVTSYLLIKQFRLDHKLSNSRPNSYNVPQFNYHINEDLPMTSGHVIPYRSDTAIAPLCAHCEKELQHSRLNQRSL